jgi:predicted PurR-regulated permease PerM
MDRPDSKDRDLEREGRRDGKPQSGDFRGVLLIVAGVAVFLYLVQIILMPFVVAGIIAYVSTPLLDWLARRTKLPRPLFAALLFLLVLGIAGLVVAVAGQSIIAETEGTLRDLQGTLEHLLLEAGGGEPIQLFGRTFDAVAVVHGAFDRIHDWFGDPQHWTLLAGYGLIGILGISLTIALLIWLLVTGPSVARSLLWLIPPGRRALVSQIWVRLDPILKRYFIGIFAIIVYATIASYIGLALILGLHHAVVLALMTGFAEALPFVGSTAAAVIAGLVALHSATGLLTIAAFAAYAVVLRLSIDQLVAPLVLGRAANIHAVLIIFCLLAGGVTFGVAGVILSVPVALTVKSTLEVLYGEDDS